MEAAFDETVHKVIVTIAEALMKKPPPNWLATSHGKCKAVDEEEKNGM
jgi:hypothetical protein